MYKPIKELSIGFTYRSKTDVDMDGETKIHDVSLPNSKVDVDDVKIDHPAQFQLGVRYIPVESFSVEVDLVYTLWSEIDNYKVYFDPALLGAIEEKKYNRDWEDTLQVRVGAEWKIDTIFALRGGYYYDPSPIPDDTFDTMWPDADKHTFSLGGGINFTDSLSLDLVVQYSVAFNKRKISGESENLNDAYYAPDGTEGAANVDMEADGDIWGYGATLTYRF
jgi:long-chain fatty acid transport protein